MTVVFILSALSWRRIRGLYKLLDGRNWLWANLGLALRGGAGQNMIGVMVVKVTSFKMPACLVSPRLLYSVPLTLCRPLLTHTFV